MVEIDHVAVIVPDLMAAHEHFASDHGLVSVEGGRHTGHGTANRIVPMGRQYIELMAVVDPQEASGSPFGSWVASRSGEENIGLLCLRTDDIVDVAERLDLEPAPMTRETPDGKVLSWRLAGLPEAMTQGLPFFMQWDVPPESYPGRLAASHRVEVEGYAWVELSGDEHRVVEWVGTGSLPLRFVDGEAGPVAACISTSAGDIVIGR